MLNDRIVLDTNCLIAALARNSEFYPVWKGLQEGRYNVLKDIGFPQIPVLKLKEFLEHLNNTL